MKIDKPMTAVTVNSETLSQVRFPKYGSIKLDGIRCMIKGTQVLSRSGKPIRNKHIQKYLAPLVGHGFDGELLVYDEHGAVLPFNGISSAVMSVEGTPEFSYNVFDLWAGWRGYEGRYSDLCLRVQSSQHRCYQLVMHSHTLLRSMEDLLKFERNALTSGHEGVILREPLAWYKHGKSTMNDQGMLKLKRALGDDGRVIDYMDDEGIVVGFDEYMITEDSGKYVDELGMAKSSSAAEFKIPAGILGKLYLRLKDGTELAVGSGLTLDERRTMWQERGTLAGKYVKFKYMAHGAVNKPRHPVFLGIRDPIDLDIAPFGA